MIKFFTILITVASSFAIANAESTQSKSGTGSKNFNDCQQTIVVIDSRTDLADLALVAQSCTDGASKRTLSDTQNRDVTIQLVEIPPEDENFEPKYFTLDGKEVNRDDIVTGIYLKSTKSNNLKFYVK